MIVLDTNVISTMLSDKPDEQVLRWLDAQPTVSMWISSVTVFEVRLGLEILPRGRRRSRLEDGFDKFLHESISGRVIAFDTSAAVRAAEFSARRRGAGRPVDVRDAMIAGIVIAQRATLATRNLRHFDDPALRMLDPWDARAVELDRRWLQPSAAPGGRGRRVRVV